MNIRLDSSYCFTRRTARAAALIAFAGCAPFARTSLIDRGTPPSSSDDNTFALAASASRLAVSVPTLSRALDRIDQRSPELDATYRHTGSGLGVTVYVFDGGVSTLHPELAGRVRLGFTAFPSDPKICNAHGTAVAGAIAGATLGVAPEAEIVDVKMVECASLRGTIRAVVEGAKWVVEDHKVRGGPAVANWSFIADTSYRIPAIDSAVTMLRDAGIAVIVSAGNYDIDACHVSPGNSKGAFVVGAASLVRDISDSAHRFVDRRAPNTAYGSCIDLYAPGDSVLLPSLGDRLEPITQAWNGTSMATGYVSGAAALYLQLQPQATPDQVTTYLQTSATGTTMAGSRTTRAQILYVGPTDRRATQVASRKR